MDIIYESVNNFIELTNTKYRFVFSQNRKSHSIVLDFHPSDYRHATGLHHVTDIVLENNPSKLIYAVLKKTPQAITDEILEKSRKYKEFSPYSGSIKERVSDFRYLENCLDTSDFMRIYQIQRFGSQIRADFFIESFCKAIRENVYIFLRKRAESDNYVIVSFFRKKVVFEGISTYWLLKEKITPTETYEIYKRDTYQKCADISDHNNT